MADLGTLAADGCFDTQHGNVCHHILTKQFSIGTLAIVKDDFYLLDSTIKRRCHNVPGGINEDAGADVLPREDSFLELRWELRQFKLMRCYHFDNRRPRGGDYLLKFLLNPLEHVALRNPWDDCVQEQTK